jgi:tetratricopeptide (TPR) repeat protein
VNPIGSTLGQRYQILEQLGQHGSVTTFLALDLQVPGNLQLKCVIHCYELPDSSPDSPDWDRATLSAQSLYTLSRQVNSPQERLCPRLPMVYGYFAQDRAFYIVREFIAGIPLAQELASDRSWTQSQVVMLLKDLLEVLRDMERVAATPPILLSQLIRRTPDRQLVLINLPLAIGAPQPPTPEDLLPPWRDLDMVGSITIAAAMGIAGDELPLIASQKAHWTDLAPQVVHPELIEIIDRLITPTPADRYPSIAAAWQAVVGVIPQLLVHQHSRADTRTEIHRHVRLYVDRGAKFYEVGDCPQAIAAYDLALSLDPQCVDAYCGRGNARRFGGDYSGSWEDFDVAVQLAPDRGAAYIGRGLASSFKPNSIAEPQADFELGKDLLAQCSSAIDYVMRGTAKAQLQDPQGAIADYDTAIGLNPRLVVAYNNRGNLRQHLGDLDGAILDFSLVLKIDPKSAISYNNRAIIYTQIGQFSAAIADYNRAIELQPNFVSVYNNLGNNYCQMGETSLAIVQYSKAVTLDPEFAVAYSNRANVHRIQGDLITALVDYDRAISLDRSLTVAYYNRGICHRQSGNHQAAIDNYTQTLALDPQYFYAYYHRGNARQYLGDKRGAIADYTQTIYFEPHHLHAYYNRAITRSEINDFQGAAEDLDRAIELNPTFAQAYHQRGRIWAMSYQHQYALVDYQQAIDLNPAYLDAYYYRGCSYQSLDNLAAAIADFSHSLDIDPNYAPAYVQRGKVYERLGDRTGAISNYHQAAKLYLDRGDSKTYQQLLQILDRLVGRG